MKLQSLPDKLNKGVLSVVHGVRGKKTEEEEQRKTEEEIEKQLSGKKIRRKHKPKEHHKLRFFLQKAGIFGKPEDISKSILMIAISLNVVLTAYLFYKITIGGYLTWLYGSILFVTIWLPGFALILLACWLIFYLVLDVLTFRRTLAVETVLPDFLQLTAANIRAGMPIDRALWFAVRPRFGVLAREIEEVAKNTLSGEDLNKALRAFSSKYDSPTLKRSINLLIEGLDAGGEVGSLLNKISSNIQEIRNMKKEMAASVTTYVIFIAVTTVLAAPFLFALAYNLLSVIQGITGNIDVSPQVASQMMFNFSGNAIALSDFKAYSIVSLLLTSMFSAIIIAIIRKGNVKEGMSYIPIFMISSIVIYLIALKLLTSALGGIF